MQTWQIGLWMIGIGVFAALANILYIYISGKSDKGVFIHILAMSTYIIGILVFIAGIIQLVIDYLNK